MSDEQDELRELIQEAHRVMKDLRHVLKQARDQIDSLMVDRIEARLDEVTAKALTEYQSTIMDAIEKSTTKVFARFDKLTSILLDGRDRKVSLSIEEYIRQLAEGG